MSKTVTEAKSIHDLVWEALTRGVTKKLENENTAVDRWSPNNVRRVIISPEGVVFQPFVTTGTFYKSPIVVVDFPISEQTSKELSGKSTISSILYRNRVFSSIEEIVVIPTSPLTPYTLQAREIGVLQTRINSFKRLADIIIIKDSVNLKEFVASNLNAIRDKYSTLATSDESRLGNHQTIKVVKDWYNHTALRPQYYSLDSEDKPLSKYFKDVKENLSNLDSDSIVKRKKPVKDEKESNSAETEKKPISELAKSVLTYRLLQLTIASKPHLPKNRLLLQKENRVLEVKQIKTGLGFDFDSETNAILKRLGLYEEGGSSESSNLVEVVSKQIVSTLKRFLVELKDVNPLFGVSLDRKLKPLITSSDSKNKSILKKIATLGYREGFNATLLDSPNADDSKNLLIDGISSLTREDIESLVKGVLFDLDFPQNSINLDFSGNDLRGISSSVNGLDMLVLHDLYIFANKVNHRMYNSLFVSNREGNKGYVTDQRVGERIRLLVKEAKVENSETDEYERCLSLVEDLLIEDYKHMFKGFRSGIKSGLSAISKLDKLSEIERKKVVANTVIKLLNEMTSRKDYKLALSYSWSNLKNSLKVGGQGGLNGWDKTVNDMIDYDKPLNNNYSVYLELLKSLLLKK